jgi:hypothetical protein
MGNARNSVSVETTWRSGHKKKTFGLDHNFSPFNSENLPTHDPCLSLTCLHDDRCEATQLRRLIFGARGHPGKGKEKETAAIDRNEVDVNWSKF